MHTTMLTNPRCRRCHHAMSVAPQSAPTGLTSPPSCGRWWRARTRCLACTPTRTWHRWGCLPGTALTCAVKLISNSKARCRACAPPHTLRRQGPGLSDSIPQNSETPVLWSQGAALAVRPALVLWAAHCTVAAMGVLSSWRFLPVLRRCKALRLGTSKWGTQRGWPPPLSSSACCCRWAGLSGQVCGASVGRRGMLGMPIWLSADAAASLVRPASL